MNMLIASYSKRWLKNPASSHNSNYRFLNYRKSIKCNVKLISVKILLSGKKTSGKENFIICEVKYKL